MKAMSSNQPASRIFFNPLLAAKQASELTSEQQTHTGDTQHTHTQPQGKTGKHLKTRHLLSFSIFQEVQVSSYLHSRVLQPDLLLSSLQLKGEKKKVLQSNSAHAQDLLLQEMPSLFSSQAVGR